MSTTRNMPIRPSIAVGVGVTGHSDLPHLDESLLRRRVGEVLQIVRKVVERLGTDAGLPCSRDTPALRIVSCLAAGADQIVSSEALDDRHGFRLNAVLPFDDARYRHDFDARPGSLKNFEKLLARSESILQLYGPSDGPALSAISYEAAGRTVLSHSDILIAVWDGEDSRGRGGTAEIVLSAYRERIPVIWIDASSPHHAGVLSFSHDTPGRGPLAGLETILEDLLKPRPLDNGQGHGKKRRPADPLRTFFEEQDPRSPSAGAPTPSRIARFYRSIWVAFFNVLAPPAPDRRDSMEEAPRRLEQEVDSYRPLFEFADRLARHYAALYRSSFLINYALGALAVTSALLANAMQHIGAAFVAAELTIILVMLINFATARTRRWQTRSVDYRLLAEQFRLMMTFAPLGQITPFPRRGPFHRFGPADAWPNWYFRAVVRCTGMVSANLDEAHVASCRKQLRDRTVRGQLRYHRTTGRRYRIMERRLHRFACWMFSLTGFFCALHLAPWLLPDSGWGGAAAVGWLHHHSAWLTLFAAALPAWGAASHAVLSQAEVRRLAERYESMTQVLESFDRALVDGGTHGDKSKPPSSLELILDGKYLAGVLLDEVADWRAVYRVPETVLT